MRAMLSIAALTSAVRRLLGDGVTKVGLGLARLAQILMFLCALAVVAGAISAVLGETRLPGPFSTPEPVGIWAYLGQTIALGAAAWLFRATACVGLLLLGHALLPPSERELRDAFVDEAQRQGII